MLLSSNLWVEPAFPHSHSFKLTEQVRDKWVKAEGQTLRTFIPPGGAQSVWGFLVTNEGIHEVHYDTGRGIRTDVHCSPWIFNILWLSGFILRRNLSQLGESCPFGTCCVPAASEPPSLSLAEAKEASHCSQSFCAKQASLNAPSVCIWSQEFCLDVRFTVDQ